MRGSRGGSSGTDDGQSVIGTLAYATLLPTHANFPGQFSRNATNMTVDTIRNNTPTALQHEDKREMACQRR